MRFTQARPIFTIGYMVESNEIAEPSRADLGIPPLPLTANQTSLLIEALEDGETADAPILVDTLANRIPPGVDDSARLKAAFLGRVALGESPCPVSPSQAVALLGTMLGGYNVEPLVNLLGRPCTGSRGRRTAGFDTARVRRVPRSRGPVSPGQRPRPGRDEVMGGGGVVHSTSRTCR